MDARAGTPARDNWGVGRYERTAEKLLPAAQVLVDHAALRSGEHVVDVGCGTGNVALLAAADGARVTAVDPSSRLLGVTDAAARRRGLDVTCMRGEAAALPLRTDSVDCYLSNFGLVFAPDPEAVAAETARVLAAGGRALFTAWLPGGALGALTATAEQMVRAALGARERTPFPWHDTSTVSQLFARHGLATASVGRHDLVFTGSSPQAYLDGELASDPLALARFKVLEQRGLGDEARDRFLNILTEGNEKIEGFGSTSQYVVVMGRSS